MAYGAIKALDSINFSAPGQIVALLGANGAGKTTVICAISVLTTHQTKRIILARDKIQGQQTHTIIRQNLGVMLKGRHIVANLTVKENRLVGAYFREKEVWLPDLRRVFELFPRLQECQDQSAGILSGGKQQMLALSLSLDIPPLAASPPP